MNILAYHETNKISDIICNTPNNPVLEGLLDCEMSEYYIIFMRTVICSTNLCYLVVDKEINQPFEYYIIIYYYTLFLIALHKYQLFNF